MEEKEDPTVEERETDVEGRETDVTAREAKMDDADDDLRNMAIARLIIGIVIFVVLTAGNAWAVIRMEKLATCIGHVIDVTDKRQGFADDFTVLDNRESEVFARLSRGEITREQGRVDFLKIQDDRKKLSAERDKFRIPSLEECR